MAREARNVCNTYPYRETTRPTLRSHLEFTRVGLLRRIDKSHVAERDAMRFFRGVKEKDLRRKVWP